MRARDAYMAWDEALFPHETVLPVSADNLLAFCKRLSDMGYSYHTILSMYFSGVCSWVSSIYLFIYLFSVFNHIPLCMAVPKNSGMWIRNHKAEYLQFSHSNNLCVLQR